jgi:hypothetical protein
VVAVHLPALYREAAGAGFVVLFVRHNFLLHDLVKIVELFTFVVPMADSREIQDKAKMALF